MFISKNGLDLIKEFEGCILQSYDDYNEMIVGTNGYHRGTLTIGYGHIEGVYGGQVISQEEAEELLKNDMVKYCNQVQEVIDEGTITFPITQNMFDALVSFDYNLGQGSLRTLCKNRDKQTVADKMLLYINAGSVWEEGLLRRRNAERDLFLSDGESGEIIATPQPQPVGRYWVGRIQQLCNYYDMNIAVDNIWGNQTENAVSRLGLCGIAYTNPACTRFVQERLGISVDGVFYTESANALCNWQVAHGLEADSVAGFNSYKSLALED